jgi:hypothetical protein
MMSILEDVFRGMLKKKYETDENFDIIINTEKGDLEAFPQPSNCGRRKSGRPLETN